MRFKLAPPIFLANNFPNYLANQTLSWSKCQQREAEKSVFQGCRLFWPANGLSYPGFVTSVPLDINTVPQTDQGRDRLNWLIVRQREVEMKTNQTELGSRSRSSHRGRSEPRLSFLSLLSRLLPTSSAVVFFFFFFCSSGTGSPPAFPISPWTSHSVHSEQAVLFHGPLTSNMSYSRNDNDRNMPGKISVLQKYTAALCVAALDFFLLYVPHMYFLYYVVVIDLVSRGVAVISGCFLFVWLAKHEAAIKKKKWLGNNRDCSVCRSTPVSCQSAWIHTHTHTHTRACTLTVPTREIFPLCSISHSNLLTACLLLYDCIKGQKIYK